MEVEFYFVIGNVCRNGLGCLWSLKIHSHYDHDYAVKSVYFSGHTPEVEPKTFQNLHSYIPPFLFTVIPFYNHN